MKKSLFFKSIVFFILFISIGKTQITPPPPPPVFFPMPMMYIGDQKKYTFRVYLKNGDIVEGESQMYLNRGLFGKAHIEIDDDVITPFDTDSIESNFKIGHPYFDFWLFEILEGKISGYCKLPEYEAKSYDFISKGDGEKLKYNIANLKKLTSDNDKAYSQLKQYEVCQYLKWGMIVGGAALAVSGFASFEKGKESFSEQPGSSRVYLGLGIKTAVWQTS